MNTDYRLDSIYVDEETGEVYARCYDNVYGEKFEKYLGNPNDYQSSMTASMVLEDSNFSMKDELRNEIISTFGLEDLGHEIVDTETYDDEIYDGNANGIATEDDIDGTYEFQRESFNLREALNRIDLATYNAYDLRNLYESVELSEEEKKKLATLVYDQEDPSIIYDTLNNKFLEAIGMNEEDESPIIHERPDGSYLVAASSGDGYTAFNKSKVCLGHISANSEQEAKSKFNSNKFDEALNEELGEVITSDIDGSELEINKENIFPNTTSFTATYTTGDNAGETYNFLAADNAGVEYLKSLGFQPENLNGDEFIDLPTECFSGARAGAYYITKNDFSEYGDLKVNESLMDEIRTASFMFDPKDWVGGYDNLYDNFGYDKDEISFMPHPYDKHSNEPVLVDITGYAHLIGDFQSKYSDLFESIIGHPDRTIDVVELDPEDIEDAPYLFGISETKVDVANRYDLSEEELWSTGWIGAVQNIEDAPFTSFDQIDILCYDQEKGEEYNLPEIPEDIKAKFIDTLNKFAGTTNTGEPLTEASSTGKTFAQWFDETQQHGDDDEFYPFDNYVKQFPNAEVLRNATAENIRDNAHKFYDLYPVDSDDREKAFQFASEELDMDYDVFYTAWLKDKPINTDLDSDLRNSTNNFTNMKGSVRYESKEDALAGRKILKRHYKNVKFEEDNKGYYVIYSDIINESLNESLNHDSLKSELETAAREFIINNLGYDDEFVNDYIHVDVHEGTFYEGEPTVICEIRTELSYASCTKLADVLNPIIIKHDANAYFDMEDAHTLITYMDPSNLNESHDNGDGKHCPYSDDWEDGDDGYCQYSDYWDKEERDERISHMAAAMAKLRRKTEDVESEADGKPYTHTQVFDELKLETRNFTIDGDIIRYAYQSEADHAAKILNKHYSDVIGPIETVDDWFQIEFSGKKHTRKTESVEADFSDPFRDTNGKIIASKWYASAYPGDEVGVEQLDGLYLDDILANRSLVDHCDTQVRDRVYQQLDRYSPVAPPTSRVTDEFWVETNEGKLYFEQRDWSGVWDATFDDYVVIIAMEDKSKAVGYYDVEVRDSASGELAHNTIRCNSFKEAQEKVKELVNSGALSTPKNESKSIKEDSLDDHQANVDINEVYTFLYDNFDSTLAKIIWDRMSDDKKEWWLVNWLEGFDEEELDQYKDVADYKAKNENWEDSAYQHFYDDANLDAEVALEDLSDEELIDVYKKYISSDEPENSEKI